MLDCQNDKENNSKKVSDRLKYLEGALEIFKRANPSIVVLRDTAQLINNVYWGINGNPGVLDCIKSSMLHPEDRIDHHKIISGTQCAIMLATLIRTEKTAGIRITGGESRDFDEVREINARFALYVALDILEQWGPVDITPLSERDKFMREHKTWLCSSIILRKENRFAFPFFAVSQLWYLAEELCKSAMLEEQ